MEAWRPILLVPFPVLTAVVAILGVPIRVPLGPVGCVPIGLQLVELALQLVYLVLHILGFISAGRGQRGEPEQRRRRHVSSKNICECELIVQK